MDRNTKVKSEQILKLFNEGVILTKICEITSSSQSTVKKVLKFFEIDYDLWAKEDYESRLNQIPILYKEGLAKMVIADRLHLTSKTVRTVIKSLGLYSRNRTEQWFVRYGTTIDENCFDVLTADSLYWLGLLYADGHIKKSREYSIGLTLHGDDLDHLKKFHLFLNSNRKISADKRSNCYTAHVNSKKIYERLCNLGFRYDKSYTAKPHELFKNSRDFWRGVVDGDGGVYNRTDTPSVFLCGTLETIFDFIIFCTKYADIKDKYPTKANGKVLYQVAYYGQDAIKIATVLYGDSEVHLPRKYQKFLEIKLREK